MSSKAKSPTITGESSPTIPLVSSRIMQRLTETYSTGETAFPRLYDVGGALALKRTRLRSRAHSKQSAPFSGLPSTNESSQTESVSYNASASLTISDDLTDLQSTLMTGALSASMQSEIQKRFDGSIANCLSTTTAVNTSPSGTLTSESMDAVLASIRHLQLPRSIYWIELDASTMEKLSQLPAEKLPLPLKEIDCYPIFAPGVWESRTYEPQRYAKLLSQTLSAALLDSSSSCDLKQASLAALSTAKVFEWRGLTDVFAIRPLWEQLGRVAPLTRVSNPEICPDPSSPSENPPGNSNSSL